MKYVLLLVLSISCLLTISGQAQTKAQAQRRAIVIFFEIKETNLEKSSTVAINTLSERLSTARFRVTANRREATLVIDGTISSRLSPVADEVKREGGVNADATASVRLLAGDEVIATSVERTAPGDWGVQADRVGEDRLIEVAGRVADDLFSDDFIQQISPTPNSGSGSPPKGASANPGGSSKIARKPARKPGVSFLEIVSLVQNYAPEDRIVSALKKYGIKFKPRDPALNQLRSLGATESLITAVKSSSVVS
jgi:hypothetical protein